MAKKKKSACYCSASRDGKGIRSMVCSRSRSHTRRAASREGRREGATYGKVFKAAPGNC